MNGDGRISTRVSAIDLETMHVTTATGRIYCLDGPPGDDLDAAYLYVLWLESCGRTELTDLSRALLRLRRIRLNLPQSVIESLRQEAKDNTVKMRELLSKSQA